MYSRNIENKQTNKQTKSRLPPLKLVFRLACHSPHTRIAASPRDHRLLFQSCSSQRPRRFQRAALLLSSIEVNCMRSAALGKAARLSIDYLDAAYRLVFPLRPVALAQFYKYHHQIGNAASGKLI